jgi:hypothetical protein
VALLHHQCGWTSLPWSSLAPCSTTTGRSLIYNAACLAPHVWVWGVWFGFALRCIALLCGVFVRLHLALFPAGGPFLPALYVTL